MPSSYSSGLRLELPVTGEQAGTWGETANRNIGTLLEQAISGASTITMLDADYTLSALNGAVDEARSAVLIVEGVISAIRTIIIPPVSKLYVVANVTFGGISIRIGTATGVPLTIPDGVIAQVFCDGDDTFLISSNQTASTGTVMSVTALPPLTGGTITGIGSIGLSTIPALSPGTYGSLTTIPVFTVDSYGRVTAASQVTITTGPGSGNQITNTGGTITCTPTGITMASTGTVTMTTPSTFQLTGNQSISKALTVNGQCSFTETSVMTIKAGMIVTDGNTQLGSASQTLKIGSPSGTANRVLVSGSGSIIRGLMWDGSTLIVGRGVLGGASNSLAFAGDTASGTATFTVSTVYKTGGGSFAATSDERLKDIHGPYSDGMQAVLQLQPIEFNYKNNPDETFVGLSAQEVLKSNLSAMVSRGEDGYLKLDPSELIYTLVNAVKEINSRLIKLENA